MTHHLIHPIKGLAQLLVKYHFVFLLNYQIIVEKRVEVLERLIANNWVLRHFLKATTKLLHLSQKAVSTSMDHVSHVKKL